MTETNRTPWIQHFDKFDIKNGFHNFEPNRTWLIQILAEDELPFPEPKYEFSKTFQFVFFDTVSPKYRDSISQKQAADLVNILLDAFNSGNNVVVHCFAGLSRSSAVACVGEFIGFKLEDKIRIPNELVMQKMFAEMEFLNLGENLVNQAKILSDKYKKIIASYDSEDESFGF